MIQYVNLYGGFNHEFLLKDRETEKYYVWSDPDYNGDNTIKPYQGNPKNFVMKGFSGRWKGIHRVSDYCGDQVKILN